MASELIENDRIFFPSAIYSEEAVELTAYIFEDKADFSIEKESDGVNVIFQDVATEDKGGFINEVLNQQCRIDLSKSTRFLMQMIVAKSIYSAIGDHSNE